MTFTSSGGFMKCEGIINLNRFETSHFGKTYDLIRTIGSLIMKLIGGLLISISCVLPKKLYTVFVNLIFLKIVVLPDISEATHIFRISSVTQYFFKEILGF